MITIGLTAVGSGIGHSVLRSLRVGTIPVRIVGFDANPAVPYLGWCDAAHILPRADAPGYVETLMTHCRREGITVVVPGSEPEMSVLVRHLDDIATNGVTVITASPEVVDVCTDKQAMADFATAHHLPFVATWSLRAAQGAADTLPYPVIVKPRFGAGSMGVRLVFDRSEMAAIPAGLELVVQEFAGERSLLETGNSWGTLDQSREFALQYSVGRSGAVLGRFVSINELKSGIFWGGRPLFDESILEQGMSTVQALIPLGMCGPFNLQGRVVDGRLSLYEANARFTGGTIMRSILGFREVEAAIHALALGDEEAAAACLRGPIADVRMSRFLDEVVIAPRDEEPPPASTPVARPQRVLVSGASGYIGRAIVARLAAEPWVSEVVAAIGTATMPLSGHPAVTVVSGSLPEHPWDMTGVDVVIHTAAARPCPGTIVDAAEFYRVNAEGAGRVAAAARQAGVSRFIYLSSMAVYGTRRPPPWSEVTPPEPGSPYGHSKWFGELLTLQAAIPTTMVLRLVRVYGLSDGIDWKAMPHLFTRQAAHGADLEVFGSGKDRMDLIHIRDVCDAMITACTAPLPPATVLNLGSGHAMSVLDLAGLCRDAAATLGIPVGINHVPARGPRVDFGLDTIRARSLLGWRPKVELGDGLRELIIAAREAR